MSWPRAAQPTELAAWRRRREQDVAIRAFRRGRYSDTEFRAAAANAQLPADALEDEVLQRRELATIVGWSLALKSKPSNTGLKWAGEAADADRRGAQHPRRLGWLSLGALRAQASAFRQADGGWAADADSVPSERASRRRSLRRACRWTPELVGSGTTTPRPAGPRRRSVEARHPRNRGRRGRTRHRWVVRAAPLCICAARASASTASSWDWTDQA